MSDSNLLNCPFCGSEARIAIGRTFGLKSEYQPCCIKCNCMLGIYETEKEAIKVWNIRKAVMNEKEITKIKVLKNFIKDEYK